ncbi:MAG: serine/threonine-protein kinase [Acidimicrobiales bacterium]
MASDAAARSPLEAVLPEYEIQGELGRGAMGVVLAARHRTLDREVAIKELPFGFALDDTVRQRFVHEAQTLASLNHPHVVQVFDFVDRAGHLALIMERLPGGTVWEGFTSRGVTAPVACGLILAAAAGLDHAHRHGVLHRDVKPDNLMFTGQGWLKVTDFGIAKVMGGDRTLATADGAILGTPAYMAPEQAEGLAVGPAADVYACATMLHEMLCGLLPFARAATPMATLIARIRDDAPPLGPRAPHVPPAIAAVVDRGLARSVADRHPTVEDFAVALGQAAAGAWGSNWLAATGLSVAMSDAITWACRTPSRGGGGTLAPGVSAPLDRGPAAATVVDHGPAPAAVDLTGVTPSQVLDVRHVGAGRSRPTGPRLRSGTGRRPEAADPPLRTPPAAGAIRGIPGRWAGAGAGVARRGRRSARARRPVGARLARLVAALLTAAVAAVALVGGPGAAAGDGPGSVGLDLSAPAATVTLDGDGDGDGAEAGEWVVRFSVLGIPLGRVRGEVVSGGDEVSFVPGYLRWTVAGRVDAWAQPAGGTATPRRLEVRATQPWLTTAPALVVTLLALFGLASASSHRRGLVHRPDAVGALLGLGLAGAVLGSAVAGFAWVAADRLLAVPTLAACAALGALAGLSLGWAMRSRRPATRR